MSKRPVAPQLSFERQDLERRLGFPTGKFTHARAPLTLLLGVFFAFIFYAALHLFYLPNFHGTFFAEIPPIFYERGSIPYAETLFAGWGMAILLVKWRKLALQRRALTIGIVPPAADFVISPDTANIVLTQIERAVDNPRRFVLFSRIATVLSALRNLGRVSDVDEMFARQADIADEITESSYSLLKGLIWAIPVLGFIGTVVGLSAAIGSFGAVLSAGGSGIEQLKEGLQKITVGLAVAFDTTLVGLLQALALQMLMTLEKSGEEQFLDDCRDYCHRRIVARLRVLPLEAE